jgi:hypothetical protein
MLLAQKIQNFRRWSQKFQTHLPARQQLPNIQSLRSKLQKQNYEHLLRRHRLHIEH